MTIGEKIDKFLSKRGEHEKFIAKYDDGWVLPFELMLIYKDGVKAVYNITFDEIRVLTVPEERDLISEDEWRTSFSKLLCAIMARNNISQSELVIRTGINKDDIIRYCSGKVIPPFNAVDKIARALECPLDDFLNF